MRTPTWALDRVLHFLNAARRSEDILNHPDLRDDPDNGVGYAIGEQTAENIISHKRNLPRRRFQTEEEILAVPGIGKDKLRDLLHSFGVSADDAFVAHLRKHLLGENWELRPQTVNFASLREMEEATQTLDLFGMRVGKAAAAARGLADGPESREFTLRCRQAYAAGYPEAHLASFPFANWWYLFDQDNWFPYEKMRLACEGYLNHHGFSRPGMEFMLFQLYNDQSRNPIGRREMIPVVLNFPEHCVTVWDAVLND